jgi:hypothetical protein
MVARPNAFPDWCMDGSSSKVTQPTSALALQGYVTGQPPTPQNFNWMWYNQGQWLRYLDGVATVANAATALLANMRLLDGGNWTWAAGSGTLAWSAPFHVAIPGLPDSQNACAASSASLTAGEIAYVEVNIPFNVLGDVTSGSVNIANVSEVAGLSVGQTIIGANIPGSTTILSISGTTVTMSNAATGTATQEPIQFSTTGALTVQVAVENGFVGDAMTVVIARCTSSAEVFVGVNASQMILRDTEQKLLMEGGFGDIISCVAGVALTHGQAVYVSDGTDGKTAGKAYLCDASISNGITMSGFAGFVMSDTSIGSTVRIIVTGVLPYGTYTAGSDYYVNPTTPGAITATKPTNIGQYVVRVGTATDTSHLLIRQSSRGSQPGDVVWLTAGVNITAGQPIYISPGTGVDVSRTVGSAYPCDTSATNGSVRAPMVGIALSTTTSGNQVPVGAKGRASYYSGLTPGVIYYADPTVVGGVTSTQPGTINQWVTAAGVAADSATLLINSAAGADSRVVPYSASQPVNLVFASPVSGGAGAPSFRTLAAADVPPSTIPVPIFFGDGHDGNVTVSTTVTLVRDMYYNNLTINSGGVIQTAGFKIFVAGTLTFNSSSAGAIINNGIAAPGSNPGAAALPAGTVGGSGAGATGPTVASTAGNNAASLAIALGGVGGAGAAAGGAGGTISGQCALQRTVTELIYFNAGSLTLIAGGTGGGSGGSAAGSGTGIPGGGGGSGGGVVALFAQNIVITGTSVAGTISAQGGGGAFTGGTGSPGGGGGGGGGGFIYIIYQSITGSSVAGFVTAAGGPPGGNGGSSGAIGSAGNSGNIKIYNIATGASKSVSGTTTLP